MSGSLSTATSVKRHELLIGAGSGHARAELSQPAAPAALVVLGHGAGGDAHAAVLVSVRDALLAGAVAVALVDQPYRVAGHKTPDRADRLDVAMLDVLADLRSRLPGVPVVLGGKSSGARVGCRTAAAADAVGVVAMGFPLVPPGRPDRSRALELDAGCPVLVLQGSRDVFGTPDEVRSAAAGLPVTVHPVLGGDHSFAARRVDGRTTADCIAEVARIATAWVLSQVR